MTLPGVAGALIATVIGAATVSCHSRRPALIVIVGWLLAAFAAAQAASQAQHKRGISNEPYLIWAGQRILSKPCVNFTVCMMIAPG